MIIRFALIAGVALSLGACQSKTDVTENIVETNTSEAVSNDEGANDTVISDAELANGTENSTELENGTN